MSKNRRTLIPTALLAISPLLAACGGSDDSSATPTTQAAAAAADAGAGEVVEISMVDNAFEPSEITVEQGEEVTFRFTNEGSVVHEAVIGDMEGQMVHGEDLEDDGEHSHGSGLHGPAERNISPGETAEISYTFDEPGTQYIGCHEPGHWEDGMKVTINVE